MANATLGMAADAFRAAAAEAPHPQPPLLPFMPDAHLVYVLPALMYWAIGLTFHAFDVFGLFAAYKLHTSAEVLRRNHATLAQVLGTAIAEQVGHALIGYYSAGAPALVYSHEYGIARWAQDIRAWRLGLAKLVPAGAATAAKVGAGVGFDLSSFVLSDVALATAMYWIITPAFQFTVALFLADTMHYFTHRLLHENKFLYKHIHALHHELHVPYAFGAFYNHPVETILIDAIGFPMCLRAARLSTRQTMVASCVWTMKAVVDHCGYAFPYDPCNLFCSQSQWYHDVHHQTWGTKYNFSNISSFWDRRLGTLLRSTDAKAASRYARERKQAEEAATAASAAQLRVDEKKEDAGAATATSTARVSPVKRK